jgi:ribosomal RNA assembly protein
MKEFFVEKSTKVKKAARMIEDKIKIRISVVKNKVVLRGNELNEFLAGEVIHAIDFGFEAEDALLLKNEDFVLEFINIKEHTRRRNLEEVRSRVIGTDGKAKKTIEELTGGVMVINENSVGLIVHTDHLESAVQGIILLIQGAKHGNVFSYLEKQNRAMRRIDDEDLGLKNPEKDLPLLDDEELEDEAN